MARKEAVFLWTEVRYINCYALFMGYLLMGVRGLGYLVIMWSTVVLLGGYVSDLEKKDFWSLTIITFVLTPRVSADVGLTEKLTYISDSILGLGRAMFAALNPNDNNDHWLFRLLARVVLLCHLLVGLVGPIVVCPLAALYVCGPLFSGGISVWRLIEHDYVVTKKEETTHLQPALIILYSLAMLQSLLFCYRFYSRFTGKDLVDDVVEVYKMVDRELVEEYLSEMVTRCEKDPSFFKETNLATYAVGLVESRSFESFLSGARILHALLKQPSSLVRAEELISLVASSSHVLEKLLQALDSTSPHGNEIRGVAAHIVAHLAGRIPLMQFPQAIQRIGSLIHISQQLFEEDCCASSLSTEDYKKLMENGFVILRKLAADEDNCRAISNAQGLLSKVLAPVSSDLLHLMDHEAWSTAIVDKSLQVLSRLAASPGETGAQLRSQISSDKEAIHGMERILRCCGCSEHVRILSIQILTQLAMGMDEKSVHVNKESREGFIKMLPSILTDEAKECSIRELAGEALVMLSQSKSDAAIILKANDHVVRDLTKILLDVATSNTNRISAAETLNHLYIHYKENAAYLKTLKEPMEDVIPKVLREILPPLVLKGNETQAENGTDRQNFALLGPTDIEAQVRSTQDDGRSNITSTCQQNDEKKLHAALLSLAAAVFDKLISQHQNLCELVDKISPGDSATSFANKINEMVRENSEPMASCLSIVKNASKIAISMMNHNDCCLKEHFLIIFVQSLSDAYQAMSCLESSVILYIANGGAMKAHKTLASLLKEAQELAGSKEQQEL